MGTKGANSLSVRVVGAVHQPLESFVSSLMILEYIDLTCKVDTTILQVCSAAACQDS